MTSDEAVEAAARAAEHAYEFTPYAEMAAHAWLNAIRAAWPIIAARVQLQGWTPFGTHAGYDIPLEFSDELDESGLPLWERVIDLS